LTDVETLVLVHPAAGSVISIEPWVATEGRGISQENLDCLSPPVTLHTEGHHGQCEGNPVANGHNGTVERLVRSVLSTGTVAGLSDGDLLARFAKERHDLSEVAFSALVERHGPMVMRVCRVILRNEHDAQDAFQATFLILARKAGSLWTRDSLGPWLYGVAVRTAWCARATQSVRQERERKAAERTQDIVDEKPGDDDGRVLHEEIERLPELYRRPIVLYYFEGLSHAEAASRLHWPVGTVRSRLARARERLRARLTRRGVTLDITYLYMLSRRPGSLPVSLINSTVQAAKQVAVHNAVGAGLVSASAAVLAEGMFRTMFFTKLKATAALLLAAGIVATGVRIYAQQTSGPGAGQRAGALPAQGQAVGQGADEPGGVAADLIGLLRKARREQLEGDMDGAIRDLKQVEVSTMEWRGKLMSARKSRDERPSTAEPGAVPTHRLPTSPAGQPGQPGRPEGRLDARLPLYDAQDRSSKEPGTSTSEHRLNELERKVDGILSALERIALQSPQRTGVSSRDQKPVDSAPMKLEGRITKVDGQQHRVEINIGSDDGLVPGHELDVHRVPHTGSNEALQLLGRIRILQVDPDQSVAEVMDWIDRISGPPLPRKRLKEGDRVSTHPLPPRPEVGPSKE
jgi:RNA polymerase sigma factor (sigma-70 family)